MTAPAHLTAYADQLAAASAEARGVLRSIAAAPRAAGPARLIEAAASPWLTNQRAAVVRSLAAGRTRPCIHLGPAPRVAHAAVWAPGRLVCSVCLPLLVPDREEDTTCDRCRQPAERIHAAVTALGPVLLAYGLCRPCLRTTERRRPRAGRRRR